jgi:hypothetical protein
VVVVTYLVPVQYQDPVGLLGPPPLRLRYEPLVVRVALDDLDIDAEASAVRDDLVRRANSPWRDLPKELGSFQTAHKRLIK